MEQVSIVTLVTVVRAFGQYSFYQIHGTFTVYLIRARRLLLVAFVLDRVPPLEGRLRVAVGEALESGAAPDFQVQKPDWPRPGMKKVLNKVGLSNIS